MLINNPHAWRLTTQVLGHRKDSRSSHTMSIDVRGGYSGRIVTLSIRYALADMFCEWILYWCGEPSCPPSISNAPNRPEARHQERYPLNHAHSKQF